MGTENNKYSCCNQQTESAIFNKFSPTQNSISEVSAARISQQYDIEKKLASAVPFVEIYIDDVVLGAKEILKAIRPKWDLETVEFKLFTDGITNKLVGCFYKGSCSNNNNSCKNYNNVNCINGDHMNKSDNSFNNVVLVRVYGNKTDLLIDRKAETRNIKLLHSYGFAPSLFATFKNGLAYEYVPGVTLSPKTVLLPEVWKLVACRMAEMHKVTGNDNDDDNDKYQQSDIEKEPMLWKKTQRFFNLVPQQYSDSEKHKRLESTFLPIAKMRSEFDELYKHLISLDSPIVFAHNDLLLGNVIYTESLKRITFIDYEYADYNFQAFDIGNHFAEFAGVENVDYQRYPTKEFQMEWLKIYLQTYLKVDIVPNEEVEKLYIQVNQFALAAHFFWTIWSLIQAEHSTIDFDFVDYAYQRYNEYLARKDEFLSLKINKCR